MPINDILKQLMLRNNTKDIDQSNAMDQGKYFTNFNGNLVQQNSLTPEQIEELNNKNTQKYDPTVNRIADDPNLEETSRTNPEAIQAAMEKFQRINKMMGR